MDGLGIGHGRQRRPIPAAAPLTAPYCICFLAMLLQGRWRHLPHAYNAQKRIKYHHPELWDLSQIAVIHYGEAAGPGPCALCVMCMLCMLCRTSELLPPCCLPAGGHLSAFCSSQD